MFAVDYYYSDDGKVPSKSHLCQSAIADIINCVNHFFHSHFHSSCLVCFVSRISVSTPAIVQSFLSCKIPFIPIHSLDFFTSVKDKVKAVLWIGFKHKFSTLLPDWKLHSLKLPNNECLNMLICGESRPELQSDIRFVISTSGSTGEPKIVEVSAACIEENVSDFCQSFNVTPADRIIVCAPLTFDAALIDVLMCIQTGADLILMSDEARCDPVLFCEIFRLSKPSYMQCTPTFLRPILARPQNRLLSASSPLRLLVLGGESFPNLNLIVKEKCQTNCTQLCNVYGVTELSSWASIFFIPEIWTEDARCGNSRRIPLGNPLSGVSFVIEDPETRGELVGNCRGELVLISARRWTRINGEKCVRRRTGDLVQRENGAIFFEGRLDTAAKRFGRRMNFEAVVREAEALNSVLHAGCFWDGAEGSDKDLVLMLQLRQPADCSPVALQMLLITLFRRLKPIERPDRVYVGEIPSSAHNKLLPEVGKSLGQELSLPFSLLWSAFTKSTDGGKNFTESGGDSISLLLLSRRLSSSFSIPVSDALNLLLTSTYDQLCNRFSTAPDLFPRPSERGASVGQPRSSEVSPESGLCFVVLWRYNLGKCIDAPITLWPEDNPVLAFAACHSCRVAAVVLTTGAALWDISLPGRVEAAPVASLCGRFLLVGCHDHRLYMLQRDSGAELWSYATGDVIKAAVMQDRASGLVLVASHDRHIHCLDLSGRKMVWSRQVDGAGLVAGPTAAPDGSAIAASLGGRVMRVRVCSGAALWQHDLDHPVFAAPCVLDALVLVGTVAGAVHALSLDEGAPLWSLCTEGPVFCTPTATPDGLSAWCGSHDHRLRRVDLRTGRTSLSVDLEGPVFAQPKLCGSLVIAVASSGSLFCLDAEDGHVVCRYNFPAKVFSTAAAFRKDVVIGCRNNFVYCLRLCGE